MKTTNFTARFALFVMVGMLLASLLPSFGQVSQVGADVNIDVCPATGTSSIYVNGHRHVKTLDNGWVDDTPGLPVDLCLVRHNDADTGKYLYHKLVVRTNPQAVSPIVMKGLSNVIQSVQYVDTNGANLNYDQRRLANAGILIPPGGTVQYRVDLRYNRHFEIGVGGDVDKAIQAIKLADQLISFCEGAPGCGVPNANPLSGALNTIMIIDSIGKYSLGYISEADLFKEFAYVGIGVAAFWASAPISVVAVLPGLADDILQLYTNDWFLKNYPDRTFSLVAPLPGMLIHYTPVSGLPSPVKVGDIVKWDGDEVTSWLVVSDGTRRWIPTGGDYLCFEAQGAKVHVLAANELDKMPDIWGQHAKCDPNATDAGGGSGAADTWAVPEEPPVPQQLVRNRRGEGSLDFNGDGKGDIFRTNGTNWKVSYGGNTGWKNLNTSSVRLDKLAFGDFNGDGKTDVFHPNGSKWQISYGGNTGWKNVNTSGFKLDRLAFGDFDGDGKTDVFRTSGGNWYVSYGATSPWTKRNSSAYKIDQLAFADFDGDGATDVFRTHGVSNTWYVSYGARAGWQKLNSSAYGLSSLGFGDFNGDGKADVFRTHWSNKWYVSRGGNTGWKEWNSSSVRLKSMGFADFNGDGKTDVFRSHWSDTWYTSYSGTGGWKKLNTSSVRLSDLAM